MERVNAFILACLISVSVALVAVIVSPPLQQAPIGDQANPSNREQNGPPEQHASDAEAPAPVQPLPKSQKSDKSAPAKQHGKWYGTFADHPAEWTIAAFTIMLAVYTRGLYRATLGLQTATRGLVDFAAEQARDMKASIGAAKEANELNRNNFAASQRPWIKVTVEPVGNYVSDGNRATIALKLLVENVGRSPALAVFPFVMTHPGTEADDLIGAYERLAATMARPTTPGRRIGSTIYPDGREHNLSGPMTLATWHRHNIEIGKRKGATNADDLLGICVCVSYASIDATRPYQTGFIFHVMRKERDQEGAWSSFGLEAQTIPAGELDLFPHPLGERYV